MNNGFEGTGSAKSRKAKWHKPVFKMIKAGSAEVNAGTVDDGDPSSSLLNS